MVLQESSQDNFCHFHTRLLKHGGRVYLVLAASDGRIFLYLVPPLITAPTSKDLARVQVAPIARPTSEISRIGSVSGWSTPISDALGQQIAIRQTLTRL